MLSERIFTLTLNALNDAYSINAAVLVLKEQLQILKVILNVQIPLTHLRTPFFSLICIFFPLEVSFNHYRSHCIYFLFRQLSPGFIHTPDSTLFHRISPAFISSDLTAYFHSIPFASFLAFVFNLLYFCMSCYILYLRLMYASLLSFFPRLDCVVIKGTSLVKLALVLLFANYVATPTSEKCALPLSPSCV